MPDCTCWSIALFLCATLPERTHHFCFSSLYRSCADWRHAAEAKGPKLEDFMSVTCSNKSSSSSLYDSCSHADHEVHDLQPFSGGSYFHDHGHGSSGGIGLGINMNAPPCSGQLGSGFPDHHQFLSHHGEYFLGTPANPSAMPSMPVYSGGGGGCVVGGSMSISGIKSWLREAMYVPPERSAALSLSVADVPAEPPQLLPAPMPVARKPAQTFGQRTSQFRGVTRFASLLCSACLLKISRWLDASFLPSISLILMCNRSAAGTDGQGGMKLTCGTTLAGRKARLGRDAKVSFAPFHP